MPRAMSQESPVHKFASVTFRKKIILNNYEATWLQNPSEQGVAKSAAPCLFFLSLTPSLLNTIHYAICTNIVLLGSASQMPESRR